MKTLSTLLEYIPQAKAHGSLDKEVHALVADSRKVAAGDLFVAVKGTGADGHDFIDKAVQQGATAVVAEHVPAGLPSEVTWIEVDDSAEVLGLLASAWYDYPSERMIVVGVTGTNGKTTIATLLYQLMRTAGYNAGLLSTVCNYVDGEAVPSTHTTPDPLELQALLGRMADAGCAYVFMEVSSHSVVQRRIAGIAFDGGIFTNLTRDHLDYHKTVDNYLRAKKKFFDDLPPTAFALTNLDDKNGKVMLQNTQANRYTYSMRTLADYKGKLLESSFDGMTLQINGREVTVPLVGEFNASNLLAIYGASQLLRLDRDDALVLLSTLHPVAGRFECVRGGGKTAIVDYAHTPDALKNVLGTIRQVLTTGKSKGKILTVVGCGGNRDKGKRPLMARQAFAESDTLILTSDNPRFEKPADILADMTAAFDADEMNQVLVIENREQAIRTAARLAGEGDIILIAGKGHETYQEIEGVKHPFNDKEIIEKLFKPSKQ